MKDKVLQARMKLFKLGIKQYKVANFLGIRDDTLSRMFTGRAEMPDKVYRQIMDYLERFEGNRCEVATR